ncbi:hypothetical protein [Hymenobacter terrenus]|uniref:hypothetical protein n=1 Tax=Hymenobacter terrenus TaxID=1629124 RepID=UPI0012E0416A|nr:hypothetical protein [Hymenobacter terrenus]
MAVLHHPPHHRRLAACGFLKPSHQVAAVAGPRVARIGTVISSAGQGRGVVGVPSFWPIQSSSGLAAQFSTVSV